MPQIMVEVDVDEVIGDISTQELMDELEERQRRKGQGLPLPNNFDPVTGKNSTELMEAVYESRRSGNDTRVLELVDRLIYASIGRIV